LAPFGPAVSEEKIFLTLANQKQELPLAAIFVHLIPFGQQTWPLLLKIEHMVKLHVFGNNSKTVNNIRNLTWVKMNKNCPWRPYLLAEWDEMKKLYRGPYIDAFCQVWFHLVQLFQRSRLKYEKLTDQHRKI
jgi:hypothetical protein